MPSIAANMRQIWKVRGTAAGVALLIALVLGLEALASSPTLHLRLCPNAGRPGHHCAVTDFAAGLVEIPVVMSACLTVLLVVFAGWTSPEILHRVAQVFRLSPSRAPPVCDSFSGKVRLLPVV